MSFVAPLSSTSSAATLATGESNLDLFQTSPLKNQVYSFPAKPVRSEESDEDEDNEEIETAERLIQKLNSERSHRGPMAKAKPRKKGIDVDNELDTINRKLLNVGIDENAVANSIPEDSLYLPNDPSAIRFLLPTHAQRIVSALNHHVLDYVLNAMKQIRRYMCVDEIPDKTERVLDLNVLPRIRELLISSTSHIQYEACWILTNIAAGNSGHTSAVVNSDFIPPLIALLTSETDQVRVQAAWALGNIAGDCKEYTQLLLDHGIIQPLLAIPYRICYDRKKDIQARHVVCWVIANLCRWDNKDWKQVEPCFEVIQETVLRFDDQDVLSEAIWAMSRIFHAKNSGCEQLIRVDLIRKLVQGINSPRLSVQTPVLRCMTNISGDLDPSHTQVLIDAGILESIKKILSVAYNHQPAVIAEVLHCLSNITAGTTSQKQAVHTVGLFRHVHDLLGSRDMKVRKEACHVLRNAVDRDATPEHFRDVVGSEGEIFLPLTTLLADSQGDLSSQLHVIETLNIIFSRGNEPEIRALYPNFEAAVTGQNVYVTAMTEMSPQNFANIFKVYEALFLSPDDDLAPLMVQCVVAEREVQKQNGVEEKRVVDAVVGHFKPGLSGADFVKAEKLRRAVARDLGFMMDQYLHVQRKKVVDDLVAMDLISGGLERLVVAVRGREAQE